MNENCLISVIVPVYNLENHVSSCLDSLLNQDYKNLEIIAVDDGSIDLSGKILDKYAEKDARIKVLHKENGGVSSARIAGIKASSGDYIGFADGDDFVEHDMFSRLIENALENSADISHCGYKMVFPSRKIDYYYNTGFKKTYCKSEALSELLKGGRFEPGLWNKIFKKEIVEKAVASGEIEKCRGIKINEDLLMNYFFFKYSSVSVYDDFCPYGYILRSGSASTSDFNPQKIDNLIFVRKTVMDDIGTDSPLYSVASEQYLRILTYALNEKRMPAERTREIKEETLKELKKCRSNGGVSKKVIYMAQSAVHIPLIYGAVRKTYDFLSGNYKKYSLDK